MTKRLFVFLLVGTVCMAMEQGIPPLHQAVIEGNILRIKELLNPATVNAAQQNGATPLYIASQNGHCEVVKLLLASGANKEAAMQDGFTPLYIAMYQSHEDIVKLLVMEGPMWIRALLQRELHLPIQLMQYGAI
jgi:ankyrin repeat protein